MRAAPNDSPRPTDVVLGNDSEKMSKRPRFAVLVSLTPQPCALCLFVGTPLWSCASARGLSLGHASFSVGLSNRLRDASMRLLEKAETPGYDSRADSLEADGSRESPGV